MRTLTESEALEWCASHHVALVERRTPRPDFADSQKFRFKIPGDAGRRIALLHDLFRCVPTDQEVLLWLTERGVWSSGERVHMFERFRASYGEHRGLSEAPAHVLGPADREALISSTGFAILFLWDCHILTSSADTWLFLSHDEYGWICSRATNVQFICAEVLHDR